MSLKNKINILVFFVFFTLLFISCKKKEDLQRKENPISVLVAAPDKAESKRIFGFVG